MKGFLSGFVLAQLLCLALGYHFLRPTESTVPNDLEAVLYLPVADAKGNRLSEEELSTALSPIVKRFGGATLDQERVGYWHASGGEVQREPVRPLMVTFRRDRLSEFRQVAEEVGRQLKQESMYVQLQDRRVELIVVTGSGTSW